jgi:hypothetical protein
MGKGSYVDSVTQHVEDVGKKAKLHFERQCMGEQNGRLAVWSDSTVTTTAETTAIEVTGDAFFDTMYLLDGEEVEFRAPVNGTATLRENITTGTHDSAKIYSVDRRGTKKTGSVTRGRIIFDTAIADTVTQNDWITLKDAYTTSSASDCLEMNGLRNLITDGVDHSGDTNGVDESTGANYTNTWNLAVTSYDALASYCKYINDVLDEENLLETIMEAQTSYAANPNMLIVSKRAMLQYFLGVYGDRRFNTMTALEWTGGYKGLGIQLGDKQLMLTTMNSVPSNVGFLINTNDFAFIRATNGYEWLTPGGRILQQKEASDEQFAAAVDYRNLVCFSPKTQTKLYGITE